MSQLQASLGYGKAGIVELDTFTRIMKCQFYDTEEVRMDRPLTFDNTFEYIAVADSGSLTSSAVWNCIRITWINSRKTRMQYQSQIAWDSRTQGWN